MEPEDRAADTQSEEDVAPTDGTVTSSADEVPGDPLGFAFENPLSDLPEVARRLLLAAKDIVATQGFSALSLNSVSAASGENKAMVSYYFGGKAGLIAAVLDSVIHDDYLSSVARMKDVESGERGVRMIEEMRRITAAHMEFRVFFELLPVALRDEMLRKRIALLYEWYRKEKLEWLGVEDSEEAAGDPEVLGLAQLLSAFIDGIAIQTAIDPDLDLSQAYDVLTRMIEGCFPALVKGRTGSVAEVQ